MQVFFAILYFINIFAHYFPVLGTGINNILVLDIIFMFKRDYERKRLNAIRLSFCKRNDGNGSNLQSNGYRG